MVAEQCKEINITNPTIMLEPVGRNTAPAIAAAAVQSIRQSDKSILLILSADHVIKNVENFHKAIKRAVKQAENGKLVTFGVVPKNANTGYGYIKLSEEIARGVFNVEEFVEKPDLQTAQLYLEQGNFLWNSGMFAFQAKTVIDELAIYSSDMVKSVKESVDKATKDLDFIRLEAQSFASSPSDSIDYALMEKSSKVVVV